MGKVIGVVKFAKGYRVGGPAPSIPQFTLLRALASAASQVSASGLLKEILSGNVFSTDVLPAVEASGCLKALLPLPRALAKACEALVGFRPSFATASFMSSLARACTSAGRASVLRCLEEAVKDERVAEGAKEVLGEAEPVILARGDEYKALGRNALEPPVASAFEQHNTIDRVTGAASPYTLVAARPRHPMAVALQVPDGLEKEVAGALELLGEMGIGGARSRGWGRFEVLGSVRLCDEDLRALESAIPITGAGGGRAYALLGELRLSDAVVKALDLRSSAPEPREIYGLAPPAIPFSFAALAAGSLVRVVGRLRPQDLVYVLGEGSAFPFTALAMGGA
ncbi:MAG: RAMP superfamily CRISPR-associated protein [Desulfurococcaceae archaeon]